MKLDLFNKWPPPRWTCIFSIIGIIITVIFFVWLRSVFVDILYPIDPFKTQLTFSGPELRSHFTVLAEKFAIGRYSLAHGLDYVFIIIYSFSLFFSAVCLARFFNSDFWRHFGFAAAIIFPIAGFLDAIENLFLLFMLPDPQGFQYWLAIVYSSFAAAKWAFLLIGLLWLAAVFICNVIIKNINKITASRVSSTA